MKEKKDNEGKIRVDRRSKDVKLVEAVSGKRVAYVKDFAEENNILRRHYFSENNEDLGLVQDYQQTKEGEKQFLSVGAVIPRRSPTPIKYLEESREYNDAGADIHAQMRLSNNMYLWEGIVGTSIDILVEFLVTDFYWKNVENDVAKRILNYWSENINKQNLNMFRGLKALSKEIVLDWFLSGNAFPYAVWREAKEAQMRLRRDSVSLPSEVFLLNPFSIKIPEEPVSLGMKQIYLDVGDYATSVKNLDKYSNENAKKFAEYLKNIDAIKNVKNINDGYLPLDNKYVTHVKRKGRGYQPWGIPYLTRAFGAFASKKRLKALDDSTTEGLINMVTIFKIGDKDNKLTWHPSRIRTFIQLLQNPTASMYLVWSYDVATETVGPKAEILGFEDKYKQVNNDIKEALGLPMGLVLGSSESEKNVWVTILSLIERLQDPRDMLKIYYEDLARKIMIENGFINEYPVYEWADTKLKNEDKVKDLVMKLYDRGLLSVKTAIQKAGYNYEDEKLYREEEVRDKVEEIFSVRQLPFSSPNLGKTKEKEPTQKVEVEKTGRPKKTDEKEKIV